MSKGLDMSLCWEELAVLMGFFSSAMLSICGKIVCHQLLDVTKNRTQQHIQKIIHHNEVDFIPEMQG
jgi:hypothetical protein